MSNLNTHKILNQEELQEIFKDFSATVSPIKDMLPQITSPPFLEMEIPSNPVHESNKLLKKQNEKIDDLSNQLTQANIEISNQTKELQSIHYENLKLNAQIDILNKTIDSQNNELSELKYINAELKVANKRLEESNKSNRGYWVKSILVGIFLSIVTFVLGKYM